MQEAEEASKNSRSKSNAGMDALFEKLDGSPIKKLVMRLAKARYTGGAVIRVVKTVKSADGRGSRWGQKEMGEVLFKQLLKEEFPCLEAQEEQPTKGPIQS